MLWEGDNSHTNFAITDDATDMWEPTEIKAMYNSGIKIQITPEIIPPPPSSMESIDQAMTDLFDEVRDWPQQPPADMMGALKVLAVLMKSSYNWDPRSNLLVSRLLYVLGDERVRAHSSGFYEFSNGAFQRKRVLPEWLIDHSETVLNQLTSILVSLMVHEVPRTINLLKLQSSVNCSLN